MRMLNCAEIPLFWPQATDRHRAIAHQGALLSEIVTALDYDILSDMSVIITEITVENRSFVRSLLWCRI